MNVFYLIILFTKINLRIGINNALRYFVTIKNREPCMKINLLKNLFLALSFGFVALAQADVGVEFDQVPVDVGSQSKVLPLMDNNKAWVAKWQLIASAKESIYADFFMVGKDIYGKAFIGHLLKKAQEGVKVYLMTDGLASAPQFGYGIATDYLQELAANPNVEIRYYNRLVFREFNVFTWQITKTVASNHDKFLVVDRKFCITGGRNIGFDYYADPSDYSGAWRDSDIYMESEVAGRDFINKAFNSEFDNFRNKKVYKDFINFSSKKNDLLSAYEAMDQWINKGFMEDEGHDAKFLKKKEKNVEELIIYKTLAGVGQKFNIFDTALEGDVKVLDKVSALHRKKERDNDITPSIIGLIDASQKQVMIQNPYVVLTKDIFAALKRAQERGVEIVLHTNSPISTDSLQTQAFFIDQWSNYMKEIPDMRIFAFVQERKMHSKVFVFDRQVAIVGSYNLDPLSQNINSEVVAMVKSAELAEQIADAIEDDMEESLEMTADAKVRAESPYTLADVQMQKKIRKTLKYKKVIGKYI